MILLTLTKKKKNHGTAANLSFISLTGKLKQISF